ncbi:hypothetical protein AWC16_01635 [Mycolicibacter longobardus]|uniref:Uncharacterized protein n=1 Tax=Mycolicibacter longobardus TaxID=1108812 RepID=A0A1X1YTV6_9MYCO|nr:hypothetical protein AWC16_01635 [Mycolicibacter longobardus]
MGSGKPSIQSDQRSVQRFGKSDVKRVPPAYRISQFPHPIEHPAMREAFAWPVAQVSHRLPRSRPIEASAQVLRTDDAEHLYVDDFGSCMISVRRQSLRYFPRPWRVCQHFEQT